MNVFSHFYYAFHLNAWVYCVHVHECACIWGGNRHHVFSSIIIYFILLSQGLSLNLQFFDWLDWLAQEPQEPQVLYDLSQVLEFQRWSVISFTLPAEPSFWLLYIFFENMSISLLKHIYYKVTRVLCVFWVLGTYQVDYSQICFIYVLFLLFHQWPFHPLDCLVWGIDIKWYVVLFLHLTSVRLVS